MADASRTMDSSPDVPARMQAAVGRGAVVQLTGVGITGVLGLAITAGLSRRLGYDDLGLYSLGLATVIIVSLITRLGLDLAALHFSSLHLAQGDRDAAGSVVRHALGYAFTLGAVGAGIVWFAAPAAATILGEPRLVDVLRAFAPSIPLLNILFVASDAMRGAQRVLDAVVPRLVVYPTVQFIGVAAVVLAGGDVISAALATAAGTGIAATLALWRFLRAYPKSFAPPTMERLLRFGANNLLIQVLHYALLWMALVILQTYFGSSETGYYRAAAQTALLLTILPGALDTLYTPYVSRLLGQERLGPLRDISRSVIRLCFWGTAALSIPLVLAPGTLNLLFGANIGPALAGLAILAVGQAVSSILGPPSWILIGGGRPGLEMLANAVPLAVQFALALVVVPSAGITGAAIAVSAAVVLRMMIRWFFIRSVFGVRLGSGALSRLIVLYGVTLAVGLLVRGIAGGSSAPVLAILATAGFTGGGFLLGLTSEDRQMISQTAASIGRRRPGTRDGSRGIIATPTPGPPGNGNGVRDPGRSLSVIICTRGRPERIPSVLTALQGQTTPPMEVIVVDGSPIGGLKDLLRMNGHIRYEHVPTSRGLTEQRNAGVALSRGKVCVFLDDDAVPDHTFLAAIAGAYEAHPDAGGIGGIPHVSKPLSPLRRAFLRIFQRGPFSYPDAFYHPPRASQPVPVHRLSGCAQSYRRDVLERIRFDEAIVRPQRGEDMDMSWRVSRQYPVYLAPDARVRHEGLGWHALELDGRFEAKVVSYRRLYRKHLRGSLRMSITYVWLLAGIVGEALIYCVLKRSTKPVKGFLRGLGVPSPVRGAQMGREDSPQ